MVSTDGRASLKGGSTTRDRRLAGARHLAQNPRFIARGIFERKSPVVSYCAWFSGPPPARARAALRARDDARDATRGARDDDAMRATTRANATRATATRRASTTTRETSTRRITPREHQSPERR
jgi:hypothetical protein